MDLLSLIGLVTKRRGDFFSDAKSLARKTKNIDNLESTMLKDSRLLVKSLKDKEIKWDEFFRSMVDKTIEASLAGVYLGSALSKPDAKLEKAWPTVVGQLLPPLLKFLDVTKTRFDKNAISIVGSEMDFAAKGNTGEYDWDVLDDPDYDSEDPEVQSAIQESMDSGIGQTWQGVLSRVVRYLVTPAYAFFQLGDYLVKEEQGHKEMIRVAKKDKKTCMECKEYEKLGWQPIGSIPLPGQKCRCFDRCRCLVDYR
jgi:hypothetical protein